MVGRQPGAQRRGRRPEGLQQGLRGPEALRGQQPGRRRGQDPLQDAGGRHQHRPAVRGPEAAAAVRQGPQLRRAAPDADPDRQELPPDGVGRRRPEDHRQHGVGRRPGDDQDPGTGVGVKDAVDHRDPSAGQQAQPQDTARHGAGDGEEQQQQPQQPLLAAVGDQAQEDPRRQLHRPRGQEAQPRQEHRRRVASPGQGGQEVAPPAQGQPRQPGGGEEEEVVHQRVQSEDAVDINHRHGPSPLFARDIIGQEGRESGRNLGRGKQKEPPGGGGNVKKLPLPCFL